MKRKLTYLLAFAAASATALSAYAQKAPEPDDALSIASAKISLAQAVAAAESQVGGKASRAEFERNKAGQWVFDVEVVRDKAITNVTVDAASGNVLAAVADKPDNGGDNESENDD